MEHSLSRTHTHSAPAHVPHVTGQLSLYILQRDNFDFATYAQVISLFDRLALNVVLSWQDELGFAFDLPVDVVGEDSAPEDSASERLARVSPTQS